MYTLLFMHYQIDAYSGLFIFLTSLQYLLVFIIVFVIADLFMNVLVIGCSTNSDCPGVDSCVNERCESARPKEPVTDECPPCQSNEECDLNTLTCRPGTRLSQIVFTFGSR